MKHILYLLLLLVPCLAFSQTPDSTWIVNNYSKVEQYITMRDGVRLFTTFYIPKDSSEKHPILLTRSPYSAAPYGKEFRAYWISPYKHYFKEKYIIALQDVRGRWMSEGQFEDVRPFNANKKGKEFDEASDTYDAIDWMVKNLATNNGNVGVFGISYPGFYSTMAALSNHPALKAVSPQAPVTDWFIGDDFHHNGAFMQMDAFAFYSSFGRPRPKPTTIGPGQFEYSTKDNYAFYLNNKTLDNLTKKYMGDSIAFWKQLMHHPVYDAFWQARNPRNFVNNIKPAMLVVGGLFDAEDCFGAWRMYQAIEQKNPGANNKIVMGPWYHGQWSRPEGRNLGNVQFESNTSEWYQQNIEFPFFDFYLKSKGNTPNIAEATIFFSGENTWKQLPQWPPAAMQTKDLYLLGNGGLSFEKPVAITGKMTPKPFSEYLSDPSKPVPYTEDVHFDRTREYMTDDQRFASRRPDVLVFETDTLTSDLTLAGPVVADLMVSITGTDADFIVKVIDVFPDKFSYSDTDKYIMNGYQMLVRGEVMRGKFRNSFVKPDAFVPNKITNVKYTLPDIAHTFKKGHRLMIQVQSSWFPLVDRNPQKFIDIYHAKESDFQKATIKVYHHAGASSKIILPVVTF
ncbi:MAG: CocE/NonD family hydrolase [Chitinophagaceae bacterium]|nr:CocE/NonD family hydrolase [Chitinophagaceae bacterium]